VNIGSNSNMCVTQCLRRRRGIFGLALVLVGTSCTEGAGAPAAPSPPPSPRIIAPTITSQPQSTSVNQGQTATFTVSASGSAPFDYQWRRNGTPVAGATTPAFVLASASASDDGAEFTVAVSNAAGTVVSSAARLSVRTAPSIRVEPGNQTVLSGTPALFSVTADGTAVTYQWRRNGKPIPGATQREYAVGFPLAGDHGATYSVIVTNDLGSASSREATLTVNAGNGLRANSFANAKAINEGPVDIPTLWWQPARALGEFFGSGSRDLFVATQVYDWDKPQSEARPGELQFWRRGGAGFTRDPAKIDSAVGCIHPRTVVVADFNRDARPDAFVACHGYDRPPFPGEPNRLVLSLPNGTYTNRVIGPSGFYHGAVAADVTGDGHIDIVVTDNSSAVAAVQVLVNDGTGRFTLRADLLPIGRGGYFTAGAADVNGDGRIDLLLAGHEWESAPTIVLLNDGSGSFAKVRPVTLPAVQNEGVILDFAVFDANGDGVNEVYVLRTSGGDGTFYESRVVQRVLWPTLESTILLRQRPAQWLPFMIPRFQSGSYALVADITYFTDFLVRVP